jgi:hypothetical protein
VGEGAEEEEEINPLQIFMAVFSRLYYFQPPSASISSWFQNIFQPQCFIHVILTHMLNALPSTFNPI